MAGYLFSAGVRSKDDLKSISMTGCIEMTSCDVQEERPKKTAKKQKEKKRREKTAAPKKLRVPVDPFFREPKYRILANDRWIKGYIRMCEESIAGSMSDESAPYKLAERWYMEMDLEAAMKKRIEPMLLTEIGVDVITLDLVGVPSASQAIEAYEKMYFNCRDENFERSKSMQLVLRFAMPYGPLKMFLRKWEDLDEDGFCIQDGRPIAKDSDIWRAVAATMGYEALMYVWGWDQYAHGLEDRSTKRMIELSWKAAAAKLLSDLYTGNISHEDASRVLSTYTAQLKFISDEKSGGGSRGTNDTTKALMDILYLAAPKMVQFDASEDSARNEEIQSRIKSQLAISKQSIEDHGKQVEAEIIDAHISEAVEQ